MNYKDLFVEKYRPRTLDDMVLDAPIREYFEGIIKGSNSFFPNLLLYGKPGGGKTTIARIIANALDWETLELNASDENGVDAIREKVLTFCNTASLDDGKKLVIFEEADGLSSAGGNGSSAQQILKNIIEESSSTTRFIMTVNDLNKMDAAIKSRMELVHIVPPRGDDGGYKDIMRRLYAICKEEGITFDWKKGDPVEDFPLLRIAKDFYPDLRKSVDALQRYSLNADRKLIYSGETVTKIPDIADAVLGGISKIAAKKDSAIMQDCNNLRSYILSVEDSFGCDYHALTRECLMQVLVGGKLGETEAVRDVILEMQDRMKWYGMVLDKELHFFAMVLTCIKILKDSKNR